MSLLPSLLLLPLLAPARETLVECDPVDGIPGNTPASRCIAEKAFHPKTRPSSNCSDVMGQGRAGAYRTVGVRVGNHLPPHPDDVSALMFELLE